MGITHIRKTIGYAHSVVAKSLACDKLSVGGHAIFLAFAAYNGVEYTGMNKRTKNAVVTLIIGLALNIALGAAKLAVGILADSVAVSSDAFNNLSDAAVSVVTVLAVWLSARAADHDHPFGHGRYEYIAAFVLGAVIVAVSVELLISGVRRIIEPAEIGAGIALWVTLGASVAVKAFMAVFYRVRGSRVGSDAIKAAAVDSMSDAIVTSLVLACMLIEKFTGAHIDGYASVAVAVFIAVFAVRILRRTVSRLLGERPDPELYARVNSILTECPDVLSVHDLVINDYGAAHKTAEADAVFPADMRFTDVHAACDALERAVFAETGVRLCVHADPDMTGDKRLTDIAAKLESALAPFGATAHDIAIDDDAQCVRLDILLPNDKIPRAELVAGAEAQIRGVLPYDVEINVDYI